MAVLALEGKLDAGRERLGGKAWSITEMLRQGIPVPPAFVITADECARFYEAGERVPDAVLEALPAAIERLEGLTGRRFGGEGGSAPLLVSVRSGAAISMPGMMDTVLNLGMNDGIERGLAETTGDPAYATDTHRRFLRQYEEVVGEPPPVEPWDQLRGAIAAVFGSWNSERAVAYRAKRDIANDLGTAVTVQAMVFGNLDDRSGTGVVFSRDPVTGSSRPFGEWLPRGQGEDVVSGQRDPLPLDAMAEALGEAHASLLECARRLDESAGCAQDIEFTVEAGRLWLLQCRNAKMGESSGPQLEDETAAEAELLAEGRPACAGIATGTAVTDVDEAERRALDGEDVILVRPITSPHDVSAMSVSAGIVTEVGGATSHAAIVSRELGVPCIVGCGEGVSAQLAERLVTLDAGSGRVLAGEIAVDEASVGT